MLADETIAEEATKDVIATATEIVEMEVGTEIIHDILIESEGTTIAGRINVRRINVRRINVVAVKVRIMTEMLTGIVKRIATAVDATKTWIDHEDHAPDHDLQDEEVTDYFTFIINPML
jgi:hypothetical protein